MASNNLAQFDKQSYINIETYRKSGDAVPTPVWFIQDGNTFYVHTQADAGKVKRIRNNPRVRLNPCGQRGELKGEWVSASATMLPESEWARINQLMQSKYGLMWTVFNLFGKLRKTQSVKIKVTV